MGQGVAKQLIYKKQSGKGTPASGGSGQLLRRETANFSKKRDTYSANEITSHQQHTGDTHGIAGSDGTINGLLSPGTYATLLASLLRKNMTATAAITGLSLTIAGTGPTYTITRGSGDFLAGGLKAGDVLRITAGTYTGVARDINLLVVSLTATVLTVIVVNGDELDAQGPIASSTVTVIGKKSIAAATGHTNDWYTFEEWFSDIPKSHTWPDVQIAKADIGLPSTGNATIAITAMGLGRRVKGASQVLTSPTAETTTSVLAAIRGVVLVGGSQFVTVTSANISIDSGKSAGEAVVGSNSRSDNNQGTLKVSGTLTILYDDDVVSDMFDNEDATSIVLLSSTDASNTADFVALSMSRVKIFGDDADDGKKQIVRSYPFTAEINGAGGAALANDQTTITIQDSAAS